MKKATDKPSTSRRQFLRGAAATTGAAAIAATSSTLAATEVEAAIDAEPEAEEGYRLTQHILDYYKSAAS